jgi:hypothetical protein
MSKQRGTVKNNHEVSRSTAPAFKMRFAEMLRVNEEIQEEEHKRKCKLKGHKKYDSVSELMKTAKRKKNKSRKG